MTIILFFIISIVIYSVLPKSKQLLAGLIASVLMGVLAFYVSERNQWDLIIHRQMYNELMGGGWASAMSKAETFRSPLFVLMEYMLTFLGDERFTSATPTFIGYFILAFLLYNTSKVYHIEKKYYVCAMAFLLLVLPWHDFAAGIRGALAFSICCFALYLDFRKNNTLLGIALIISSVFIHQSAIIFLLLRLFAFVIEMTPIAQKPIFIICLLLGSLTEFIGPLISELASSVGLGILTTINDSFDSYAVQGKKLYEYRIVLVRIVALLLILYFTYKGKKDNVKNKQELSLYNIYIMLMLVSVGFIWQYDIVCRYSVASIMLLPLFVNRMNRSSIHAFWLFAIINALVYFDSYYSHWEILFK